MAQQDAPKSFSDQVRDKVIDVRNEAIMQSANLYLMARKALLASLGAAAMTLEEANSFADKLAERGELVEADVQRWMGELRAREGEASKSSPASRSTTFTTAGMSMAGKALEESIEVILNRLNVPTKSDIEALSKKISLLNQKVNALVEQQEQSQK